MKCPPILGCTAALVFFAHPAVAKSPAEIEKIARPISIEIQVVGKHWVGSGAIVQFRSNRNYQVAQVEEPGSMKADDVVYTAGFPVGKGFLFGTGNVQAVVNKRLTGDGGGYTVVYDTETLLGMSGGGAFDRDGRLVAIHGQGDSLRRSVALSIDSAN
jgi:Trypsin-like peptidase domain